MDANEMEVWVGCEGCYSAGRLAGHWVDIFDPNFDDKVTTDYIHEKYDVNTCDSEEAYIGDTDNIPDALARSGLSAIRDFVENLKQLDESLWEAYSAFVDNFGTVASLPSFDDFKDTYLGETGGSIEDFVADWYEDAGMIPDNLPDFIRYHIDWEGVARDLELNGDIVTATYQGVDYVFHGSW